MTPLSQWSKQRQGENRHHPEKRRKQQTAEKGL
jgi:hypothetical protein